MKSGPASVGGAKWAMEIQSDLIKCEAEEKIGKESYSWALEYCERCESFILAACFIVLVQNKR